MICSCMASGWFFRVFSKTRVYKNKTEHGFQDLVRRAQETSLLLMLHVDEHVHGYTISPPASIQELPGVTAEQIIFIGGKKNGSYFRCGFAEREAH